MCEEKNAITLEDLAKLDALNCEQPVLKFDQLEHDPVHMLKEYRVLETGERFTCIGTLESGRSFGCQSRYTIRLKSKTLHTLLSIKVEEKDSIGRTSLRYTLRAS